jgi:hypothetical protein
MPINAYPTAWARHDAVRAAATRWLKQGFIAPEQRAAISEAYTVDYYRPNIFLRIGLFIFTYIGAAAAAGTVALFTEPLHSIAAILLLCGIGALGILELLIRSSRHYHSGVDTALLYTALLSFAGLLCYGYFESHSGASFESLVFGSSASGFGLLLALLLLFGAATLRYADRLVAALAYLTYLAIVARVLLHLPAGQLLLPFALMLASMVAYSFSERARQRADVYYYEAALNVIKLLALISFYLAGNYLIVREGNAGLANLRVSVQIPLAPLFYLFTVAIPLAYIYFGLRQANRMMLLVGLGVVGFSIYTYRFYRSLLPPEIAAVLAGLVLITGAAAALRYLHTPKHGLTAAADDDEPHFNLESLIVAQTATTPAAQAPGFEFGGGQSGGGGATGQF